MTPATRTRSEGTAERARGRSRWAPLVLLVAASILPYLNALPAGFVYDDQVLVVQQLSKLDAFRPLQTLARPYWTAFPEGNLWRPVTNLSLEVDWWIGGGRPGWFHLVNLALHAGVVLLLFRLLRRFTAGSGVALVTALLFAVHPAHTEAVTWVSGRSELLAALFALAALNLSLSRARAGAIASAGACLLAAGSKESGAVAPFLILFTAWVVRERGDEAAAPAATRAGLLGLALLVVFAFLRRLALGTWSGPIPEPFDNPMAGLGFVERLPGVFDAIGRYALLLFWPARLSLDYSGPVIGVVRAVTPQLVAGVLFAIGVAAVVVMGIPAASRRARGERAAESPGAAGSAIAPWGAGFAVLSFLPASNLLVVIGTNLAERLIYLPSAGILAATVGLAAGWRRSRRPAGARASSGAGGSRARVAPLLVGALVLVLAARTWDRNRDYRDELTAFRAGVAAAPKSVRLRTNLALQLQRAQRYEESIREAGEVLRLDPGVRQARDILASSLELSGRPEEAIRFLRRETARDPMDRMSRRRLVGLLELQGRTAEMESVLAVAIRGDPEEVEWVVRMARSRQAAGDHAQAASLWRRAVEMVPEASDAPIFLAYCLLQTGDLAGARRVYEDALRRFGDLPEAANGLAWTLLQDGGPAEDAVRWARRAVAGQPTAPHYETLARACLAAGLCGDALEAAQAAARLDPGGEEARACLEEVRRRCP